MCKRNQVLSTVFAAGACWAYASADVVIRPVLLSGDAAPGLPGVFVDCVGDCRINQSGQVLVSARLRGMGVMAWNDDSIWSDRSGTMSVLLRSGDSSRTGLGDVLSGVTTASFNDAGRIALAASFLVFGGSTSQPTRLCVLREDGANSLLLRTVEAASSYTVPALIPLGGDERGILWNESSRNNGFVNLASAAGGVSTLTPVPGAGSGGVPADATFRQFSQPAMNTLGRVAFRAAAGSSAVTDDWKYALYSDRNGSLDRIAVVTGLVPAGPPGRVYTELTNKPVIDESGQVVFWAKCAGGGVPAAFDSLLVRSAPSQESSAIASAGDPAPGAGDAVFSGFAREIALSETGTAAFVGFLTGAGVSAENNSGIWLSDPGQPARLLVREADAVPDVAGAVFASFGRLHLGPAGQVAFIASLAGATVPQGAVAALFATDRAGALHVVARVGAVLPQVPGPGRTIRELFFEHGGPGMKQMNDSGEIIFRILFTDMSTGAFVAQFPCFGDFNSDGGIDNEDVSAFFGAWESSDPQADANHDGGIDGADVEAFFRQWESGSC